MARERALLGRAERVRSFPIDAQQLLGGAVGRLHRPQHPLLDDRRAIGVDQHGARIDPEVAEHLAQQFAVAIGADHAERAHSRSQRAQIRHHEARVARALLDPVDLKDRDRRLGRDARDVAHDVAVEDHFAGNQHAQRLERRKLDPPAAGAIGGARRFGTAAVDDSSADTLRVLHDAAHTPDLSNSLPQIILAEGWGGGPGGSEFL